VVAIIAILAAIAVPNFLEAQVRAKVARIKSDMRTLGIGLEAYAIDNNKYLPTYHLGIGIGYGAMSDAQIDAQAWWPPELAGAPLCQDYIDMCGRYMTTPVAYLTNIPHPSPFQVTEWMVQRGYYYYTNIKIGNDGNPTLYDSAFDWVWAMAKWGNENAQWGLMDGGPDGDWFGWPATGEIAGNYDVQIPYDPTNGTVSWGNIFWMGGAKNK